jgi:hypothetical protein
MRARAVQMVIDHRGAHASQWTGTVSIEVNVRSAVKTGIDPRSLGLTYEHPGSGCLAMH